MVDLGEVEEADPETEAVVDPGSVVQVAGLEQELEGVDQDCCQEPETPCLLNQQPLVQLPAKLLVVQVSLQLQLLGEVSVEELEEVVMMSLDCSGLES